MRRKADPILSLFGIMILGWQVHGWSVIEEHDGPVHRSVSIGKLPRVVVWSG